MKVDGIPEIDPAIVEAVDQAMGQLNETQREIIRERFFEGLAIREIAVRREMDECQVIGIIYESKRVLKTLLADFVKTRWGIEPIGICRICSHKRREEIEDILLNIGKRDSWGTVSRRIEKKTGERIHPPQILKAHLKHMQRER